MLSSIDNPIPALPGRDRTGLQRDHMEWWQTLNLVWTAAALTFLAAILLGALSIWRVRSVLGWGRSLKNELDDLSKTAVRSDAAVKASIEIIADRCEKILRSPSPEIGDLQDLRLYVRSIAARFHPRLEEPELRINITCMLRSLERSLNRFDSILRRPGLRRLKSINIRRIVLIRQWYYQLAESVLYRWAIDHRQSIGFVFRLRFLLLLDPLGWLVYLSRRLTVLLLVKYLMVDIYIFLGKVAMEAYSDPEAYVLDEGEDDLRGLLEELDALEEDDPVKEGPQIRELRRDLVGFPAVLISPPTFKKLGNSVRSAALIIAERHFPDSDYPLQEAALGPILEALRLWVEKVTRNDSFLSRSRLCHVRLETVYRAKNLSDMVLPKPVQRIIARSFRTYGLLKWPIMVYRVAKRATPWRLSLTIGWEVAKRASLLYLHGRTFDTACEELDRIYRLSRNSL